MRLRPALTILMVAALTAACSPPTADDLVGEVLTTRNSYQAVLSSWVDRDADGPTPWLYLDVNVVKDTEESLTRLTVLVKQMSETGTLLNEQRVSIDVSSMDMRGLSKKFGLEVRPMHPEVYGVTLEIEPNPPADTWDQFPELDRVRPRGR